MLCHAMLQDEVPRHDIQFSIFSFLHQVFHPLFLLGDVKRDIRPQGGMAGPIVSRRAAIISSDIQVYSL